MRVDLTYLWLLQDYLPTPYTLAHFMQANDIMQAMQSIHGRSGVAGLLIDILVLDERLCTSKTQSKCFQMGIQHHIEHLAKLLFEYDRIRGEFNRYSTQHFRDEINAHDQRIQAHADLTPLIARAMERSLAQRIILEMEDMIALKSITDYLPTISELMN